MSALDDYKSCDGDEELDPLERLRFFCSCAMTNKDWLDVEPFFDALEKARSTSDARYQAILARIKQLVAGLDGVTPQGRASKDTLAIMLRTTPDTALQKALLEARIDEEKYYSYTAYEYGSRTDDLRKQLAALGE